ncbi:hypothetical protein M758_5G148300 [Ceratodon purpureus]|nr:hypothetical protein M758_5G148300 [Ceratodon purpureus]
MELRISSEDISPRHLESVYIARAHTSTGAQEFTLPVSEPFMSGSPVGPAGSDWALQVRSFGNFNGNKCELGWRRVVESVPLERVTSICLLRCSKSHLPTHRKL